MDLKLYLPTTPEKGSAYKTDSPPQLATFLQLSIRTRGEGQTSAQCAPKSLQVLTRVSNPFATFAKSTQASKRFIYTYCKVDANTSYKKLRTT